MRQLYIFILACLLLPACQKKEEVTTIKGEIKGIGKDTLILYADDDTGSFIEYIPVEKDIFSYSIKADTLIQAMLVYNHGLSQHPVYLNRNSQIRISGDLSIKDTLTVTGLPENEMLNNFYASLNNPSLNNDSITEKAVSFIKQHPISATSLFIIKNFLANKDSCDASQVIQLIEGLDGELQDRFSVGVLKRQMEAIVKSAIHKNAHDFNLTDTENKKVTRFDFNQTVVLLYFWASWDDSSRTRFKELRELYETYYSPKKKPVNKKEEKPLFVLLGVSLDVDKTEWKKAVEQDTLPGRQATDLLGWESPLVKSLAFPTLPYSVVIGANNLIAARDVWGEELKNLIATRVKDEKDRREREKKRAQELEKAKKKKK